MAYIKSGPLSYKGNTSAVPNNLAILPAAKGRDVAVVDKSVVHFVRLDEQGAVESQFHRSYKHPSMGEPVIITQIRYCHTAVRNVIVITCFDAVQICDSEDYEVIYSYNLGAKQNDYTQGILSIFNTIFVGTSVGTVLRLTLSSCGNKVTELPQLSLDAGDTCAACCLDMTYDVQLVCGDMLGNITVWSLPEKQATVHTQYVGDSRYPCVSLCCYMDLAIGGYGNGQIKMINFNNGTLVVQLSAHAQWINALDLAPRTGLILSASEDSTCSVWHISDDCTKVSLVFTTSIVNVQLYGGRFLDDYGNKFVVSGYEESQLFCYTKK